MRRFGALTLIWAFALVIAVIAQGGVSGENLILDAITCVMMVFLLTKAHCWIMPRMRRWPIIAVVPVAALVYLVAVVISITVSIALIVLLVTRSFNEVGIWLSKFFTDNWMALRYPFEIAVGVSFVVELTRRIGPPRLLDLLRGRYRNPREETRVFLMIDLRGSTPLAESLGAVRFSFLLRDIFDDLTEPVLATEGDVVGYVGDEAIMSWPLQRGLANGNAIQCFFRFKARIEERAPHYQREYGTVPKFRAAIHAGPIVATEVGQIRTDVALHGDALNTAARVLAECNALEAELLVTESIATHVPALPGVKAERLGEFELRGKGEPVGLWRVSS